MSSTSSHKLNRGCITSIQEDSSSSNVTSNMIAGNPNVQYHHGRIDNNNQYDEYDSCSSGEDSFHSVSSALSSFHSVVSTVDHYQDDEEEEERSSSGRNDHHVVVHDERMMNMNGLSSSLLFSSAEKSSTGIVVSDNAGAQQEEAKDSMIDRNNTYGDGSAAISRVTETQNDNAVPTKRLPSQGQSNSPTNDNKKTANRVITPSANNRKPIPPSSSFLLKSKIRSISFNQDCNCIAIGTNTGYRVRTISSTMSSSSSTTNIMAHDTPTPTQNGISCIRMLHSTSLLAIIYQSTPRCLNLVHAESNATLGQLFFVAAVRRVEMNRCKICVLTADGKLHVFSLEDMKLIKSLPLVNSREIATRVMAPLYAGLPGYYYCMSHHTEECFLVCRSSVKVGMVSVWDGTDGGIEGDSDGVLKWVKRFKAHDHGTACMAIGGKVGEQHLATSSQKGTLLRIFTLPTCTKLHTLYRGSAPCTIYSIAFTQSAYRVAATGSSGTIHIYKLNHQEKDINTDANNKNNATSSVQFANVNETNQEYQNRITEHSYTPPPPTNNNNNNNNKTQKKKKKQKKIFGIALPSTNPENKPTGGLRSFARIKLRRGHESGDVHPRCTMALLENNDTNQKEDWMEMMDNLNTMDDQNNEYDDETAHDYLHEITEETNHDDDDDDEDMVDIVHMGLVLNPTTPHSPKRKSKPKKKKHDTNNNNNNEQEENDCCILVATEEGKLYEFVICGRGSVVVTDQSPVNSNIKEMAYEDLLRDVPKHVKVGKGKDQRQEEASDGVFWG